MTQIIIGKGKQEAALELSMLNRHGIIAGATGTGKTITLKVIAEQLSSQGIPVFLSDIKGDLSSIATAGSMNEKLEERMKNLGLTEFAFDGYPVEFWDIFGELGLPLRTTISDMGPLMLSRLLGLNEVQAGIMNIAFKVADDQRLLLIDLEDLKNMIRFVEENAKELSSLYGNIAKQSTGAILRSILVLEGQGAQFFIGEPALNIHDFLRTAGDGRGIVNVLSSQKLFTSPMLYSTFLFWMLSELYENMEEVGDLEKPKMVFFFDEAHLLFNDQSKLLLEKIELIVRLIRSKGIGVFFITQNPTDIPDSVSSQLGTRIQHALRAYSPKELKTIKAVSELFRQDGSLDMERAITELQVGEALFSTLDRKAIPTIAERAMIYPPHSMMGVIEPTIRQYQINHSSLFAKYSETVNQYSATEALLERKAKEAQMAAQAEAAKQAELEIKKRETEAKREEKQARSSSRRTDSNLDRLTKNIMSSIGREVGNRLVRGIFGTLKK